MEARPYDENLDSLYSPDATPLLYLLEHDVLSALENIPVYKEKSEIEVRSLIIELEALHRYGRTGKISMDECLSGSRDLEDSFRNEHGLWPYVTKTYEAFYGHFERKK